MDSRLASLGVVVAAGAIIFASCGRSSSVSNVAVATSALRVSPPQKGDLHPATKRPRFGEATVYVDGAPVAVMRAMEMPMSLERRAMATRYGSVDRYLVSEYLGALGVDITRVRAVHFYGGKRVALVDGDDARRFASDLAFEFAGGDRGKPRMHFPGDGFKVNTTVDMISAMTVYVDKEPPAFHDDGAEGWLSFADGARIDGVPYAPEEQLKGTRVYVDGVLVATLKRKLLPNKLLLDESDTATVPARFSLARYLESVGADTNGARAIDLVSGDDLVRRIEGPEWARAKSGASFTIPAHSQGQLAVDVPRADGVKAKISAIQIFTRTTPPKRWIAPPEFVAMADAPPGADARTRGERDDDTL